MIYYGNMTDIIQNGDIFSLTVHDEAKRATIVFVPQFAAPIELKVTDDNESAYDGMVEAAALGVARKQIGGNQVTVRYDSGDKELDEITVR
jgi:hypothetical protein